MNKLKFQYVPKRLFREGGAEVYNIVLIDNQHKPLCISDEKNNSQINQNLIDYKLIKPNSRNNFIKNVMKAILLVLLSVSCIEHIDLYHVLPIRHGRAHHHDKLVRYFST